MSQPSKPQTFKHDKFVAALMETEIAVMDAAAENMATRIFAAAHGLPLTGTLEKKDDAAFTEKSLGAVILMAGYASDRPAADALAGRLWRNLNGLPEPSAPTAAPAKAAASSAPTSTSAIPENERVLSPEVLGDKTPVFGSAARMLQVMATLALHNMQRSQRGKIVRDFIYGHTSPGAENRCTIRVEASLQSAVISIYANGSTKPLYRTVSFNELWQFARARDVSALEKIGRGMFANAAMKPVEGGRPEVDEYASGVVDTDDGTDPGGDRDPPDDSDDEGDDREPTIGELARAAAARTPNAGQRVTNPRQPCR